MNLQQVHEEEQQSCLVQPQIQSDIAVHHPEMQVTNSTQSQQESTWVRCCKQVSNLKSMISKIIVVTTLSLFLICLLIDSNSENYRLNQDIKLIQKDLHRFQNINYWMRYSLERINQQPPSLINRSPHSKILPNTLWLYTEFQLEAEKMLEEVFANNLIIRAKQAGFDIKFVDSKSAYQWLSSETKDIITKTMQNLRIQESINDVLRLALLKDNGGVVVKVAETFVVQNMSWIREQFNHSNNSLSQIVLFGEKSINGTLSYQDYILAAVKGSKLIQDTFGSLCKAISTGKPQFWLLEQAIYKNQVMNSTRVLDLAENIMKAWLQIMGSNYYKAKVFEVDVSKFYEGACRSNIVSLLKKGKDRFREFCGSLSLAIHFEQRLFRSRLQDELQNSLQKAVLDADVDSYWYELMTIPQNKKIYQPLPPRQVHYCLLDAYATHDLTSIRQSVMAVKKQTYQSWTAVYFVENITEQHRNFKDEQSKRGVNIIFAQKTSSLGRNYQVGIVKFCPNKSFVVILKKEERLSATTSLQNLVNILIPRPVLGAFVGLNVSGTVRVPTTAYEDYNKIAYNGAYPKQKDLNVILNHLRVFHSDCFKIIPQFNLRSTEGVYFNGRFIFLQIFMNMVQNATGLHDLTEIPHTQRVKWFIKKSSSIFDVPFKIAMQGLMIHTQAWEKVDRKELKVNKFKIEAFPMTYNMDHLVQNGQTMKEFAIFNPANDYQPYTKRNKPQLIPKIIHQIWIGGKMPEAKRIVIDQNMKFYPDFELKIWSKDNITRENFPLSYDLLQTLDQVESFTRFSRRATMADVMRHEILYREGGFYMDTSMMLFGDIFYKWLSYKAVLAAERTFRHRWSQSMCFFAVMPKFPGLLRIISHTNTNKYNIYLRDAVMIAGPNDFRQLIQGEEEYDPDILLMEYATFYPLTYDFFAFYQCYCAIEPKFLTRQDRYLFKVGSKVIIRDCGKYYPDSFGKELNTIGSSWQNPKN